MENLASDFGTPVALHSGSTNNTSIAASDSSAHSGPDFGFVEDITIPSGWHEPTARIEVRNTAGVIHVVREAESVGAAIVACGGETQWQTGYPPAPARPYFAVTTRAFNRVLDYQPDDLTVTCEPGVTLAQLRTTLAEKRQFLPLDLPYPDRATLGGIVSTNRSGFQRPAYGTPRDLLIGVRAVMTGGEEVKGGGKVVKNVAGYDVCKLFTGAWGTLGILTEVTFRVRPLPESMRVLAWEMPDLATAVRLGLQLHAAQLAPTFLSATNELDGRPRLLVGLQGYTSRVTWQTEEFAQHIQQAGAASVAEEVTTDALDALRDRQAHSGPDVDVAARIAALPSQLESLTQTLERVSGIGLTIHCETGIVSLSATFPPTAPVTTIKTIQSATPSDANLLWTQLDTALAEEAELSLWGETRGSATLQRALKAALDPKATFSPGRFIGRI